MAVLQVPNAKYAIIGGSSTFSIKFPEDINRHLKILESEMIFDTPWGKSPAFKLFTVRNKRILTVKMHGWRPGVSRAEASKQVFWVLKQAGVKKILSDGGVGSINHLLKPRDLLVSTDYLDFSLRKDVALGEQYLLAMRQPVCPVLRDKLVEVAENYAVGRVFDRGIYAVTDGRHFESVSEVQMLNRMGADIVGQSMCPEVYLAREIGACYARIDMVVNYAEGIVEDWDHNEMSDIFYNEAERIGTILLETIAEADDQDDTCGCQQLRKDTLLK